eukprot:m.309963 g.309963  ORF g.309963 m.309963 type:complete len:1236 (+) comp16372_c1_seq2:240-3947(+)
MGKRAALKPATARLSAKRGSAGPARKSKASSATDELQYTAQGAKISAAIQDELEQGTNDFVPYVTRLQRLIKGNETARGDMFVMPSPEDNGPLVVVLLAVSAVSPAVLPTLQTVAMVTRESKAAARLAKRGFAPVVVKVFAGLRGSRDDSVQALLYGILADIASHDPSVGELFAGHGWAPLLADFINRKRGSAKMVIPAVRALTVMLTEDTAVAYAAVGTFSTTTRLVQAYSTLLRHHVILKPGLKLLGELLQFAGTRPGLSNSKTSTRKLLQNLVEWIKLDVRRKYDDVRREFAVVLQRMVREPTGRAAFIDVNGIAVVLSIIEDLQETGSPRCEGFISQLYSILQLCRPRAPLPTVPAPLLFTLPAALHDLDKFVCDDAPEPESDEEEDLRPLHQTRTPRREHHPSATPFAATGGPFAPLGANAGGGGGGVGVGCEGGVDGAAAAGEAEGAGEGGLDEYEFGLDGLDDCPAGVCESSDSMGSDPESEGGSDEVDVDTAIADPLIDDPLPLPPHSPARPATLARSAGFALAGGSDDEDLDVDTDTDAAEDLGVVDEIEEGGDLDGLTVSDEHEGAESRASTTSGVAPPRLHPHPMRLPLLHPDRAHSHTDARGHPRLSTDPLGSAGDSGTGTSEADESEADPNLHEHEPDLPELPPPDDLGRSALYDDRVDSLFPELESGTRWPGAVAAAAAEELMVDVKTVRACVETPHTPLMDARLGAPSKEPLQKAKSIKTLRRKLLHAEMAVLQDPASVRCRTVYDVDDPAVAERAGGVDALHFESRFESGNLRQATMIHDQLYDLVLSPDINTMGHTQWFFFSVTNMKPGVPYRFNIVNLEKANSQYNFGMQPVMYSERGAEEDGLGWHRVGAKVGYLKNSLRRDHPKKSTLFTATFTITFKHPGDTCYLAYHYPFTYSDCQSHLAGLTRKWPSRVRRDLLCRTLGGNRCDLLTITSSTAADEQSHPVADRKYIVLTSRVHPGESNASWMMKGALDFLTSDDPMASELRRRFVFKIVPMLNPDGVANGNHRCSLAGADLNRKWQRLHPLLHPTIAYTKMVFTFLKERGILPELYCDFHGHSRRKMVFIYGCGADNDVVGFPKALSAEAPQFSFKSSRFTVTDDKEGSARVTVWREFGITRSYTMESTFSGFDKGEYRGNQVNVKHLESMGRSFVLTLLTLGPAVDVSEPPPTRAAPASVKLPPLVSASAGPRRPELAVIGRRDSGPPPSIRDPRRTLLV